LFQVKIWFQNRRTKWKKQDNISNAEAAEHKVQKVQSSKSGSGKRDKTASLSPSSGRSHKRSGDGVSRKDSSLGLLPPTSECSMSMSISESVDSSQDQDGSLSHEDTMSDEGLLSPRPPSDPLSLSHHNHNSSHHRLRTPSLASSPEPAFPERDKERGRVRAVAKDDNPRLSNISVSIDMVSRGLTESPSPPSLKPQSPSENEASPAQVSPPRPSLHDDDPDEEAMSFEAEPGSLDPDPVS
jgi:hypothetical protein